MKTFQSLSKSSRIFIQPLTVTDNNHAHEYPDITFTFVDGKLDTDIFAKEIPFYVPRNSFHPPRIGKSIAKSTVYRQNTFVSRDEVLEKRKTEYSRYFYASLYKPKMVKKLMDEVTGLSKDEHDNLVQGGNKKNREEITVFGPLK